MTLKDIPFNEALPTRRAVTLLVEAGVVKDADKENETLLKKLVKNLPKAAQKHGATLLTRVSSGKGKNRKVTYQERSNKQGRIYVQFLSLAICAAVFDEVKQLIEAVNSGIRAEKRSFVARLIEGHIMRNELWCFLRATNNGTDGVWIFPYNGEAGLPSMAGATFKAIDFSLSRDEIIGLLNLKSAGSASKADYYILVNGIWIGFSVKADKLNPTLLNASAKTLVTITYDGLSDEKMQTASGIYYSHEKQIFGSRAVFSYAKEQNFSGKVSFLDADFKDSLGCNALDIATVGMKAVLSPKRHYLNVTFSEYVKAILAKVNPSGAVAKGKEATYIHSVDAMGTLVGDFFLTVEEYTKQHIEAMYFETASFTRYDSGVTFNFEDNSITITVPLTIRLNGAMDKTSVALAA